MIIQQNLSWIVSGHSSTTSLTQKMHAAMYIINFKRDKVPLLSERFGAFSPVNEQFASLLTVSAVFQASVERIVERTVEARVETGDRDPAQRSFEIMPAERDVTTPCARILHIIRTCSR